MITTSKRPAGPAKAVLGLLLAAPATLLLAPCTAPPAAALTVDTIDVKTMRKKDGLTILRKRPHKPYALGRFASRAGDFNGDGRDDVVLGSGSDYVAVFHGAPRRALPPELDVSALNGRSGTRVLTSGVESVAGGGDVNGDGIDDLVLGGNDRLVRVLYGSRSERAVVTFEEPDAKLGLVVKSPWPSKSTASAVSGFGQAVAVLGDVNGDGIDDIGIGASGQRWVCCVEDHRRPGIAYVVFGRRGGFPATLSVRDLDGRNGFRLDGAEVSDQAGQLLAAAGDVNGDGLADFLVGAPESDPGGRDMAGVVYVVFGSKKPFPRRFPLGELDGRNGYAIPGVLPGDRLGSRSWVYPTAAGAGDVNGDGVDDMVFTASGDEAARTAFVVFGAKRKTFPPSFDLKRLDGTNGFRARTSSVEVAGVGDVDGDGTGDVMFGGSTEPLSGYLLLGQRKRFPKLVEFGSTRTVSAVRVTGLDSRGPVSPAGDFDGDGLADILLGAPAIKDDLPDGGGYLLFGQEWK